MHTTTPPPPRPTSRRKVKRTDVMDQPGWVTIRSFDDPIWQTLVAEAQAEAIEQPALDLIPMRLTGTSKVRRIQHYTIGRVRRQRELVIYTSHPRPDDEIITTPQEGN